MSGYDFSRSFLQFTTDHARHTPRLQVLALCTLTEMDGEPRRYALAGTCMSEHMYRPAGLIQEPASVFFMISDGREFLFQKAHASAARDIREAHAIGERMSTHDGHGAVMQRIEIALPSWPEARRVTTYAEIRAAILGNRPLNGRTIYPLPKRGWTVTLDYPIAVCNIAHAQEAWQVDTGPVLLPDPEQRSVRAIETLTTGYLLYNREDYLEAALQRPIELAPGVHTRHYAGVWTCAAARHELYAM